MIPRRHYTVAEANARLPELAPLLEELRSNAQQLALLQGRVTAVEQKVRGNGYHNPSEDHAVTDLAKRLEEAVKGAIEKLASWGIELKDLSVGLIDFPALRDGRTVYLCWQLGEPDVAYWHEITTGFAGRLPVDDKTA
jgi:hypothetical protein